MSDYISRQAAIKAIRGCTEYYHNNMPTMIDKASAQTELMMLSAADVVEVVRCKDCKHNFTKSWNQGKRDNPICHFTDFRRPNEFYCSFGKRAEQ